MYSMKFHNNLKKDDNEANRTVVGDVPKNLCGKIEN